MDACCISADASHIHHRQNVCPRILLFLSPLHSWTDKSSPVLGANVRRVHVLPQKYQKKRMMKGSHLFLLLEILVFYLKFWRK